MASPNQSAGAELKADRCSYPIDRAARRRITFDPRLPQSADVAYPAEVFG
jgi:hypothetical protein